MDAPFSKEKYFSAKRLEAKSSLPKYLRIAEMLHEYMWSAEGREIGAFPSELKLAEAFGVNRKTVRAAFEQLEKKHQIIRIKKRGTIFSSQISPCDDQSPPQIIGVVIPQAGISEWTPLFEQILEEAENHSYKVKLYCYDLYDLDDERTVLHRAMQECFGLIFYPNPTNADKDLLSCIPSHYPLCFFDLPPQHSQFSFVSIDNEQATYLLTRKLLESGCRKLGFVMTSSRVASSKQRLAGYSSALKEAGLEFDSNAVFQVTERFNNQKFLNFMDASGVDSLVLVSVTLPFNFQLLNVQFKQYFHAKKIKLAVFDLTDEEFKKNPLVLCRAWQPKKALGSELFRLLELCMKNPGQPSRSIRITPEILTKQ